MSPKRLSKRSLLIILPALGVVLVVGEIRGIRQPRWEAYGPSQQRREVIGTVGEDSESSAGAISSGLSQTTPAGPSTEVADAALQPAGADASTRSDSAEARQARVAVLRKQIVDEQQRLDEARQNLFDLQNVLDVPDEATVLDPDKALSKPSLRKYEAYFMARKAYDQSEQNRRRLYLNILAESRDRGRPGGGSAVP